MRTNSIAVAEAATANRPRNHTTRRIRRTSESSFSTIDGGNVVFSAGRFGVRRLVLCERAHTSPTFLRKIHSKQAAEIIKIKSGQESHKVT